MWPIKKNYGFHDFRERDAKLKHLRSRLSLARVQGDKNLCIELEKAIRKVH
jgi:hypothetical protein